MKRETITIIFIAVLLVALFFLIKRTKTVNYGTNMINKYRLPYVPVLSSSTLTNAAPPPPGQPTNTNPPFQVLGGD